jgi:hypothetical protein
MASIDINKVASDMLNVAKGVLTTQWASVEPFAKLQFKQLAQNLELIVSLKIAEKITEEQCGLLLSMHKHSQTILLISLEGISIVAAENAINAALGVVKDAVNTAIGFPLILI